jgi:hypothetical protein
MGKLNATSVMLAMPSFSESRIEDRFEKILMAFAGRFGPFALRGVLALWSARLKRICTTLNGRRTAWKRRRSA